MIDAHLDKPELGDIVEFQARHEYGGFFTERGEVIEILKSGKLRVCAGPQYKKGTYTLAPEKAFVVSKGA